VGVCSPKTVDVNARQRLQTVKTCSKNPYTDQAASCSFLAVEIGRVRRSEKNCLWNIRKGLITIEVGPRKPNAIPLNVTFKFSPKVTPS
jgi:hypothetical protein